MLMMMMMMMVVLMMILIMINDDDIDDVASLTPYTPVDAVIMIFSLVRRLNRYVNFEDDIPLSFFETCIRTLAHGKVS